MLGSSVKLYILWAKFWSVFPVAAWPPKARGFGGPRALDQVSWDGSHLSSSACWCELLASGSSPGEAVIRTCLKRNRLFQPYGFRAWKFRRNVERARQVEGLRARSIHESTDKTQKIYLYIYYFIYIYIAEYQEFRLQNFGIGMFASMLRFCLKKWSNTRNETSRKWGSTMGPQLIQSRCQ